MSLCLVGSKAADVLHNRTVAATAYKIRLTAGSGASLKYFRENKRGKFGGRNEAKLIQRWGQRWEKLGNVQDANHRRTGRTPKVPNESVLKCAKILMKGYTVNAGKGVKIRRGFTSLKAAVDSGKPEALTIKQTINTYGITIPGLHRRMRLWPGPSVASTSSPSSTQL
jgi:hypothetical protein